VPFIPLEVFTNQAQTTVTLGGTGAPASGTQETWTVASSSSFPAVELGAQQFHVADPALASEMITVQNVSGTTWTVIRGAEGSATVAHAAGFTVVQVVTASALAALQYPAWQFPVQAYGAQGDGKIGTGGTGTSGTSTFTDSGAAFVNAAAPAGDVGKVIIINQGTGSATVGTNPFVGTISAVNSPTSITLSGNLAANASAAPYVYGTDDSAAINAAVLAASQWAVSTGNYKAQVMFEPQLYMLGALTQTTTQQWSPFNTGLNYTYNTHVAIPFTGQYSRKLILDFIGVGDASEPDFWGSAVPGVQGTCLVSAVFPPSQPDGTFGQMSVMGTPSLTTNIGTGGIAGQPFANVLVNINGITVVTPFNGQQFSFDFRFAAQANVTNASALAFAPVNYAAQTVGGPWLRQTNIPANGVAVGLAMPVNGNNDNSNIGLFSAEGIAIGFNIGEHFNANRLATIYCHIGINCPFTGGSGGSVHGNTIEYFSCEGGDYGIFTSGATTSVTSLNILLADFEVMASAYVWDPNNNLMGVMYWADPYITNSLPSSGPGIGGAANYQIINALMYPGIWAANANQKIPAPPAAPASNTGQQNTTYRMATVYASAVTSITSFTVAPTSALLATSAVITVTAGANVAVPIRVPGGFWYKLTYAGTLTTTWILD
jgi:hypothetical protein